MITIPIPLGTNQTTASVSSIGLTTASQINTGDTVFVVIMERASGGVGAVAVSSVSDGINSYVQRNHRDDGPVSFDMELWMVDHATTVAAGTNLLVSFSGTTPSGPLNIAAAKISGLAASVVDRTASGNSSATTSLSTTTGTALSQPNEIIIGASGIDNNSAETQSDGFSNINLSAQAAGSLAVDFQIVNSLVIATYAPVWGTSGKVTQLLTTLNGGAVVNVAVQGLASCEW